jgi:flagellar basal-body rod protein FlgC
MYGSLNISTSALVAQRSRLEAISANMAMRDAVVDPSKNPDDFRRRVAIFTPGDPSSSSDKGVHISDIKLDRSPFRKVHDPGHPFADAEGYIRLPNIDSAMEMVNALEASRAYEANITAAEATKSMLQTTLRLLA